MSQTALQSRIGGPRSEIPALSETSPLSPTRHSRPRCCCPSTPAASRPPRRRLRAAAYGQLQSRDHIVEASLLHRRCGRPGRLADDSVLGIAIARPEQPGEPKQSCRADAAHARIWAKATASGGRIAPSSRRALSGRARVPARSSPRHQGSGGPDAWNHAIAQVADTPTDRSRVLVESLVLDTLSSWGGVGVMPAAHRMELAGRNGGGPPRRAPRAPVWLVALGLGADGIRILAL